jgi:hypothetical protein
MRYTTYRSLEDVLLCVSSIKIMILMYVYRDFICTKLSFCAIPFSILND